MKILVIRFKEIGDVLLTSVLCNSLKKSFPESPVDYPVYEPSAAATHCIEKYGAQILLYSDAPHEKVDNQEFAKLVVIHGQVFLNIATSTLRDLTALMINSHMFIGNECGPRHISQGLNRDERVATIRL